MSKGSVLLDDLQFHGTTQKKERRIDSHFMIAHCIAGAMVLSFLGLLILERGIPDYLIGSIVGFYLAKAPYELQ